MDRRERDADLEEALRLLIRSVQSRLWTALPGKIEAFYPATMTADVQPTINCQVTNAEGTITVLQVPLLQNVPVCFPGGGGCTLTFPVTQGDECLVVFASRCVDAWWLNGFSEPTTGQLNAAGQPFNPANTPPEKRMHNLSDGVAYVGLRNKTRAYAPIGGSAQLQTDDGQAFISLNPTTHAAAITATTLVIDTTGNVNINGAIISPAGEITDGVGKVMGTHVHTGVTTGGGDTGPPA